MKKIMITLLIAAFLTLPQSVFAETVMLDRSQPSFDEEAAYKENDYYGSYGVRGTSVQGKGVLSLYDDNGNKMIKMAIPEAVTSGYNSAMLTMFANRNHKEYYKKGVIIDLDVIAPESGTVILHTRGGSYYTFTFLKIENLKLIPATGRSTYEADTSKHATLEKGKMHNLKIVFDTSSKSYTIYLDKKQVGDKYTVQDAYLSWKANSEYFDAATGAMKEVPELYFRLMPNLEGETTYPIEAFVDNLKIISYNLEGTEVSSFFDIYDENGDIVSEYNPSNPSHKIGIDVFNNTSEADEAALLSLKYKRNENGFNLLDSYSVKKLPLAKGYNRVELDNMLIPDSDPSYVSKLIFLDSLYNPEMKAPVYSLANDGTFVTTTKTDKPAVASVVNGTIDAVNLDSEVTISGIAQDAEEQPLLNVPVGLTILSKDAAKDELQTEYDALSNETSNLSSFVYSDITTTDIDGKYTFKVEMPVDAPSGDYLLIANVGGKEVSTTLRYLTTAQKQASIKEINDALSKTAADLLTILGDSDTAFSLSLFLGYTSDEAMYNSVKDKASFFELVKSYGEYSEELGEVGDSVNRFNKNLDNAILLSNLESIDDLAELKQNAESIAKQTGLIVSGITDANNDAVYTALSDFSDFSSLDKINRCIAEAIVLYNVPNAESWGAIKTAIESYSDLLGLDLSDSTVDYDEVYHKMYDQKAGYTDLSKIVTGFNELKTSTPIIITPPPAIIPSVGGGGGGGGGGVASRPVVKEEVKEEDNKEEIINPEPSVTVMNFADVSESFWGYDAISELYSKGIVKGISETEFAPDAFVKREEFVAMIVRALSLEMNGEITNFDDVSESDWYKEIIDIACSNGIISGKGDGTFGAGKNITRQDIAVIVSNMISKGFIEEKEENNKYTGFSDIAKVADYAQSAVVNVHKQELISGYAGGDFRPANNATRAETAVIIQRILTRISK